MGLTNAQALARLLLVVGQELRIQIVPQLAGGIIGNIEKLRRGAAISFTSHSGQANKSGQCDRQDPAHGNAPIHGKWHGELSSRYFNPWSDVSSVVMNDHYVNHVMIVSCARALASGKMHTCLLQQHFF